MSRETRTRAAQIGPTSQNEEGYAPNGMSMWARGNARRRPGWTPSRPQRGRTPEQVLTATLAQLRELRDDLRTAHGDKREKILKGIAIKEAFCTKLRSVMASGPTNMA